MPEIPSLLIPVSTLPGHPRLSASPLVVLALCADWCGTCRDFQHALQRIAEAHGEIVFAWADIEDDAELVGDIEVETFPTLAIFRDGVALHFGASLPQERPVARLIDALADHPARAATAVPAAVDAFARLIGRGGGGDPGR